MTTDLLTLPFDQYQRYRDVQEIANIARDSKPLRLLDIGGHPGIIRNFLPDDDSVVVDILPGKDIANYIQTDGSNLPFKDNEFDFVCSLDALEHVPPANRDKFLSEMLRVSKDFIVLICPFFDEDIKLAEEITYEFYRKTFNSPLIVLGEHLQHGLPRLEEVRQFFKDNKLDPVAIPSGYLFNWLPMQIAKIYVQSLPNAENLHSMIDKFYNKNYYELDHRMPSYRTVLAASKKSKDKLTKIRKRFNSGQNGSREDIKSFDTFTMLMSLLDLQHKNQMQSLVKEVEETHNRLKEKDVHISNLEKIISERDGHIKNLEKWAARVQTTIPYRVYTSVKRLKKNKGKG